MAKKIDRPFIRSPRHLGERVYVVIWPDHLIVKAGYTSQSRWRSFMSMGADVLQLTLFDSFRAAFDYEGVLHSYLLARFPLAFPLGTDSRPILGRHGGSCETYRITDWTELLDLPQPNPAHVLPDRALGYYTRAVNA